MEFLNGLAQWSEGVIFAMELEDITIESTKKGFRRKPLRARDDVHVEEGVAIVVRDPHVKTFVEVFQVISETAKGLQIDATQVNVAGENGAPWTPRFWVKEFVNLPLNSLRSPHWRCVTERH